MTSLEDLVITDQRLGEGGFGSVFMGQLGEKKVAAKKLSESKEEIDLLIREASRLKRLQFGKHIAYTHGITLKEESLYMVMEYCECGDLQSYLKKNKESVTYEQKILFCRGILLGLLYCHSMNIFHGDIKCENVLLGKNLEPKLTDFGLSVTVDNIAYYSKLYRGSLYWTAPELFSIKKDKTVYQEFIADPYSCDVYSLGATFCEISYDGTTEFIDSDDPGMDIMLGIISPTPKEAFLEEIVGGCCQFERNERTILDDCLYMLDAVAEKQLPIPAIDDKWLRIKQDIKPNSKLELPSSFILYRPAENLVVNPSNLSLLEWLCINNCVDAVEYMIQPHKDDQDQIKWLYEISNLCKFLEIFDFLRSFMQDGEFSHLVLSNIIDNHPQKFFEVLIKVEPSCFSYNFLKKAIERHYNMIVQAIIDSKSHFKDWAIHDAIRFGNVEAVKILASANTDLKWRDYCTGNTPLITAIDAENIEVVKILLEFGADVYSKISYTCSGVKAEIPYKPLYLAALKGSREIVKILIDAGVTIDIKSSEWHSLSQNLKQQGNTSMVRFISNSISKKSSSAKKNPLYAAIQYKQLDLLGLLISDSENIDEIGLNGYALLHSAVIVGNEGTIITLVKEGVDLDIRTSNKAQSLHSASDCFSECTPLHIAIFKRHLRIAKLLIESGADFSAKNGLQQTVMDIAKEDRKILEKIIKDYAPANAISVRRAMESMSPESTKVIINKLANAYILSECLCIAVSHGRNDLVNHLLKHKVKINKEHCGKTPLGWAIFGENIHAMKVLINVSADINTKNTHMKAPLFQCVWESQVDMVQFLIDKGADVNVRDEDRDTAIHYVKDKEVAKVLINAGADINAKGRYGRTSLIHHVIKSNAEMVQFLVDKGADINAKDEDEYSPVHHTYDEEIIKILINAGADVNAKSKYGRALLIQYVIESNAKMVQYLIDKGADVKIKDEDRNMPIHYTNDKEIMKILINAGANISKNKYKMTPLIQSASESTGESDTDVLQLPVGDWQADLNARNMYAYYFGYYENDLEVMKIFTNADGDADVNAINQYGEILLMRFARSSNAEMVQFLIDKGVNVKIRDKDRYTPIHYVNNKEIMKILIDAGADVNAKNRYGQTPLIQFVKKANEEMVQFLVDKGADVNIKDEDGYTPIHHAYNKEIMKILIDAGADVNAKDQNGITLLIEYTINSFADMVQFLVDKGADINARDEHEHTPIYYANNEKIMKTLINAGVDVDAKNKYGKTFLIQFVIKSNAEMVQFLVDKGADVKARDEDGNMPIHYARDREIMETLIDAGADVNAKNKYGITPLIQHVIKPNLDMVQFLIDKGADVNFKDEDGNAPIHHMHKRKIAKILINAGADINAKGPYGRTPLIQHVIKSNIEIVRFLIDKRANVNVRDEDGNAPIHFVRNKVVTDILVNAGAGINAKNSCGRTSLILYVKKSNAEMVQLLINKGADIKIKDKDGNAPIHCTNDKEIMKILIHAGANVNVKNQYRRTPLIQHVSESNAEMVQFLIDKGADINAKDKDDNAPIHFVRDKKIAEILINAGADINVKNMHGKELFYILLEEQNKNLSNKQYKRKKFCKLLEYLRTMNRNKA